jgi:transcriptional regulator of acetoin/glycerol metabolism
MSEDTASDRGWLTPTRGGGAGERLALIVVWCLGEPRRVGQALSLEGTGPWIFGRGAEATDGERRAPLVTVRPGPIDREAPLEAKAISRRQILFSDGKEGKLRAKGVGKSALEINGKQANEGSIQAGDTVGVEGQIVFLCTSRPARPYLSSAPRPRFGFGEPDADGFVGESVAAWLLRDSIEFAAARSDHVLVRGPSGAGKELVANALHRRSPRSSRPLVSRSAATLPSGIVDAELFGNLRNYPNAGMPERAGLIGEAEGGTLFLDEIGEMPTELQAHLLRLLDGGEYQRLGESRSRRADVRLVAATNREEDELKHDLLGRLTMRIEVPALDERREDIPLLARHLLRGAARQDPRFAPRCFDDKGEPRLSPYLMIALTRAAYRTHVRELRRWLWLSAERSNGQYLELVPEVERLARPPVEDRDEASLSREAVAEAMQNSAGSVSRAAAALGLRNRNVLYRLLKKYGISGA